MKFIYDNFSLWKDSVYCVFVGFLYIYCDVFNVSFVIDFWKMLDDCFFVMVRFDVINSFVFNIS